MDYRIDYYRVLNLHEYCSKNDIKRSYKEIKSSLKITRINDYDRVLKLVKAAYKVLKKKKTRLKFDNDTKEIFAELRTIPLSTQPLDDAYIDAILERHYDDDIEEPSYDKEKIITYIIYGLIPVISIVILAVFRTYIFNSIMDVLPDETVMNTWSKAAIYGALRLVGIICIIGLFTFMRYEFCEDKPWLTYIVFLIVFVIYLFTGGIDKWGNMKSKVLMVFSIIFTIATLGAYVYLSYKLIEELDLYDFETVYIVLFAISIFLVCFAPGFATMMVNSKSLFVQILGYPIRILGLAAPFVGCWLIKNALD